MELRRINICLAIIVLSALTYCSEARHAMHRRDADEDVNYDDALLADEASDDEAQNDAEGNDQEEDDVLNGTIITQPEKYTVTVGKTVQLDCKVSPKERIVVGWFKDGEQYFLNSVRMRAPDRLSIPPSSSDLLISDIQVSDSGVYKCEILQEKPVSIEHTVIVTEGPRIIRFVASDQGNLVEGQDLLLTCDVAGSPKPRIIWSRKRNNMNDVENLSEKDGQFSSNTFFAKNVKKEMSGVYYCYAINTVDRAGHAEAKVTINIVGKPRVHVHKTVVNSDIGVEAILQCSAHEEPAPHIRWYKNGFLIEDTSSQYVISTYGANSNLSVTPNNDQDFGTFTCEAENRHGKHNRSIDLVQSPVVENVSNDGPKLTWTVHSHQPLEDIELQLKNLNGESEWRTLRVPLPESGEEKKHQYEIIYVLEGKDIEPGKYEATVKVKNNKSWSEHVEPKIIELETQPQPIQTASVFRGNNAPSLRPTTTATLSTILMYLLVRML